MSASPRNHAMTDTTGRGRRRTGVADRTSAKPWEEPGATNRPAEALQEGPGESPDASKILQEGPGEFPDAFWNPRKARENLRTLPKISRRVPENLRTPSCQIINPVPSLLAGGGESRQRTVDDAPRMDGPPKWTALPRWTPHPGWTARPPLHGRHTPADARQIRWTRNRDRRSFVLISRCSPSGLKATEQTAVSVAFSWRTSRCGGSSWENRRR